MTDLPTRLEVFGERGSLSYDPFILPTELTVVRSGQAEPERYVTQWPGGGYTFQAQEVMRCLRAGALESPLVGWTDTLAVARTLDQLAGIRAPLRRTLGTLARVRWRGAIGSAPVL